MSNLTTSQMVNEMQEAIEAEIKAAKKNPHKYSASDGKLLSDQAGQNIYIFTLSESWEPQDDARLKITFNGSQDIKGTVVNSTGSTITIATDKPLPSEALDKITLEDDPTELLERLKEALAANQEAQTRLGSKSFRTDQLYPKSASRPIPTTFGAKFTPDESQSEAIKYALGSEVTFIVGPPGTGKTSTLAAIAFAYLQEGRSLLIAAHTNIAIDNAIMRLADICKDTGKVAELNAGRIVRYGTPQLKSRMENEYSEVYTPAIIKRLSSNLQNQREQLQGRINQLEDQLQQIEVHKKPLLENRQSLREQLGICQQELSPYEEGERQRLMELSVQKKALVVQQSVAEREIKACMDAIAQRVAQQTQWEMKKREFQAQENSLQISLAEAQKANLIKRWSKRLNPQKLALQLGDASYQIHQCQLQVDQIVADLAQKWHPQRTRAENRRAQINEQIQNVEREIQQPSPNAIKIEQLKAKQIQYRQDLEETDAKLASLQKNSNVQQINDELGQLREQRAVIDKQLSDIEKNIVAEAQVVATTLSKTYMNKKLSERRFDVVILDEVSMAPLPSVYIATSRADQAVIALGDPQQLAPICNAKDVEIAVKWLAKDLFALNNITLEDAANGVNNSVLLKQQSRMHLQISHVAREHVYKGLIEDSERIKTRQNNYASVQPLPGKALVLCDTGDYSPIALRLPNTSHQNTYHALCSFFLACQVLHTLPTLNRNLQEGEFRVGIVTPYRSQAAFLQGMLKEAKLDKLVRVGTVHRFQGLEAEVIIFDTTDSFPLLPPSRAIAGQWGSDAMRLVNVAITRAQQKLIIVANKKYIEDNFDPNATLSLTVQAAAKNAVIQSAEILKETIPLFPALIQESNVDIQGPIDDRNFYNYFRKDLKEVQKRVIIFSPFLGWGRFKDILPNLEERVKQGIRIDAVYSSKRSSDSIREKTKYGDLVKRLQEAQIEVHYKTEMHEKFVFFDDDVVYIGSLNALSHDGTTDYMYRLRSSSIVAKIKKDWQVDTTLARPQDEGDIIDIYVRDLPRKGGICPNCQEEMQRRINGRHFSVFYSCPKCRYTDDVSTIHLEKIQRLTNLLCDRCKGPTRIETVRKDAWIVCAATPSCDYGRPICIKP